MATRHRNDGLRKICGCPRRRWTECPHSWHLNYKPRGGKAWRLSIDREVGRHVAARDVARIEANKIRAAIDAATFRQSSATQPTAALTLAQLGRAYFKGYVSPKTGQPIGANERYRWNMMMRTSIERANGVVVIGDIDVRQLTKADVDAFADVQRRPRVETFADVKGRSQAWRRGGVVSANRCLGRLRAFYNWAIEKGHVDASPFKRAGATVVRLFKEAERERRLMPAHGNAASEEDRLLAAANPHLRALIIAALETGCRVGELLSLQWHQVRFDLNEIHLPGAKTKARRQRDIPMSQRLRAMLEMRRQDPDGQAHPPKAYVFGDDTGARVRSVKTAWANAVLKAHGVEPKRERNGKLTGECQRQLAEIDLNFHDLRREAGSRMLEGAMPPNIVQAFLDHANLSTTSRYLKVTKIGMHSALKHFEEARGRAVPSANVSAPRVVDGNVAH
jgi:integrase